MSTIVVVRKNGIAAIGADTLTKVGYTRQSAKYVTNSSKIIQVGQTYIAITGAGSGPLILERYFSQLEEQPQFDSLQAIYEASRLLHIALKGDYFLNPSEGTDAAFESSQFQYQIANCHGIFGVYSQRAVEEYSRFDGGGSGADIALGAMHAVYDLDLNADEIARAGLMAAAEFDDSTGEPIEIKTIQLKQK